MARTEGIMCLMTNTNAFSLGDRQCLGVQLNLRRKDFEPLAVAYNTAAKEVNGKFHVAYYVNYPYQNF